MLLPPIENITPPDDEIWYNSIDEEIITPTDGSYGDAIIISNTYENGKGIIKFDREITSIGEGAFIDCRGLTSINIPNSVTSIGKQAFRGCTGLTSITISNTTPPTLGDEAFNNTNNSPIYVPSESVNTYKSTENWSTYADRIKIK